MSWTQLFADGLATPALPVGISSSRHAPLIVRLLNDGRSRLLLVCPAERQRVEVVKLLGALHDPRAGVLALTETELRRARGLGRFDAVLWMGMAGIFDEDTCAFADALSESDRELLATMHLLTAGNVFVATRNPAHVAAAYERALLPQRLVDAATTAENPVEFVSAVAVQFGMRFSRAETHDCYVDRRAEVVHDWFGFLCAQDGHDALLALAEARKDT